MIRSGIKAGIRAEGGGHILSGINPIHLRPLLALDFTKPTEQPIYTSAASVTARGVAAPDSVIRFDQASGDFLDGVGGVDLTPAGSWLRQQTFLGLWDGNDIDAAQCAEIGASTDKARAASSSSYDLATTGKLAFSFSFRIGLCPSTHALIGKHAATEGFTMDILTTGVIRLKTFSGGSNISSWSADNHADGTLHRCTVLIDRDANVQYIWTDLASDFDSIASLGTLSNAGEFGVGMLPGVNTTNPTLQFFDIIVWETNADQIDANTNALLQPHGGDPSKLLTIKTHASMIWDLVADGKVGAWHSSQIPIGYNAGLTNVNKMGLRCQNPVSTLLSESDDFDATWTKSNVSVAKTLADLSDSPRGFRESQKLTATADNGYFQHLFASVADTEYSIYAFLQRYSSMGTDVSGRIVAYDNIGAAEIDSQVFSAGADWSAKPIALTFTTPAGCTQVGYRIEIDTDTESICAALATSVAGKVAVPIYTTGGTASVAGTAWAVVGNASQYIKAERGEIELTCIGDVASPGKLGILCRCNAPVVIGNRRWLRREINNNTKFIIYDSVGAIYDSLLDINVVSDHDNEQTYKVWWNATVPIQSKYAQLNRNNIARDDNQGAGWTATEILTIVDVGTSSGFDTVEGLVSRLRIYDRPRTVL